MTDASSNIADLALHRLARDINALRERMDAVQRETEDDETRAARLRLRHLERAAVSATKFAPFLAICGKHALDQAVEMLAGMDPHDAEQTGDPMPEIAASILAATLAGKHVTYAELIGRVRAAKRAALDK